MTNEEKLAALKAMVGNTDSDEVLSTYLTLAGGKILAKAFPFNPENTEVPVQYSYLQVEIGAEGQTSHSENGISRTYENADVPSSMLRRVVPFCGVV